MVWENLLAAGMTVFAAALTGIGVVAYRRTHDRKLLAVTAAFALFLLEGVVLSIALFARTLDLLGLFLITGGFNFAILALMYAATLRR